MKRKIIPYFFIIVMIAVLGCGSQELVTLTEKKPEKMPDFTFHTMDGAEFTRADLNTDKGYVLVYLDPECIFCQTAIQRFTRSLNDFEDVDFLVISSHSNRQIDQFIELHSLNEYEQIKVLRDPDRLFPQLFYSEVYPVIYLYNEEGEYIADFQGLADVDDVEHAFKNDY